MTRITRKTESYDLTSPNEEQVCITLRLPVDAPQGAISKTWKPRKAPSVSGMPPSEVIQFFEEKLDKTLYSSHEKEDREAIEWVKENAERVDREWAQGKINKINDKIQRLMKKRSSISSEYFEQEEPEE